MAAPDHLLSPMVTAHCFFAPRCHHRVTDRPIAAHDAMETHYATAHARDIDEALRGALIRRKRDD